MRIRILCLLGAFAALVTSNLEPPPSEDEIYDDIFQLVEEKETLKQKLKTLDATKERANRGVSDAKCARLSDRVKELQNDVEASHDELSRLRKELENVVETRNQLERTAQCDEENEKESEIEFRGRFTFPVESVRKYDASDPKVAESVKKGIPIVIGGTNMTRSLVGKWTLKYLADQLGDQIIRMSISENHKFMYYSQENRGRYEWNPTYKIKQGTFQSFIDLMETLDAADNGTRVYFQHLLRELELSAGLENDRGNFNWNFIDDLRLSSGWGEWKDNLLLVGMRDVTTPAHYDSMENLFTMVSGYKRCFLFDPSQFAGLYPYPVHHPHDRQSQVDFDHPNFDQFPRFREVRALEAVLSPGDVLYIPAYWWHYVESARKGTTVSLNFWFSPAWTGKNAKRQMPESVQYVHAQREVETLIGKLTHPSKVGRVLTDILHRRFEFLQSEATP